MKSWFAALLLILSGTIVHGEVDSMQVKYGHQLRLIDSLRSFVKYDLRLEIPDDFYTKWDNSLGDDSMYYMLYTSMADEVRVPDTIGGYQRHFGTRVSLIPYMNKYNSQGYQTLLYKTAGLANARLNLKLLSYPDEAIAFILLHEAVHNDMRPRKYYIGGGAEEALCDAVANYGCIRFAKEKKMFPVKAAEKQKAIYLRLYAYLNKKRKIVDSLSAEARLKVFPGYTATVKRMIARGNLFQKERMTYDVNNAYFLRVEPYALHYFDIEPIVLPSIFNMDSITAKVSANSRHYVTRRQYIPIPEDYQNSYRPYSKDDYGTPIKLAKPVNSSPWSWP